MPGKNQAQKRRDRAKIQRDREGAKPQQGQSQAGPPAQSERSLPPQQQNQVQQVQPISTYEILDKEGTLAPAIADLENLDLISKQEAQEIRKIKISPGLVQQLDRSCQEGAQQEPSQQETARQEFLNAVSERLQAFLSDDKKPSKQRRQVRRAKEIIQYHQDFPSRYRATHRLRRDQRQSLQEQRLEAQPLQQRRDRTQSPQEQVPQAPVPQERPRPAHQQEGQAQVSRQPRTSTQDSQQQSPQAQAPQQRQCAAQQQQGQAQSARAQAAQQQSHQAGQRQGQALQPPGPSQAAPKERHEGRQQQRRAQPLNDEDFFVELVGTQFAHLIKELRLLRIMSTHDVHQIRPPQTGEDWYNLITDLEGKVESRAGSATRSPQKARALHLIAGLKTLITQMVTYETPQQQQQTRPPPAAVREEWIRREVGLTNFDPTRRLILDQEAAIREEGRRFMDLLEAFQTFGLVSQEEIDVHRVPQSWSTHEMMLDTLHGKIEAFKRSGGGDGDGRSAEQLERLSALQSQLIVYQVRYRGTS